MVYDVIVAGGGPAGLTAALYAARSGCSVLVLERTVTGGQIIHSPLVENFPGLPAVSGTEFAETLERQATDLGVKIEYAAFTGFHRGEDSWAAETNSGERQGRALILALGAEHRKLGLPGEEALTGRGVSYCAMCDGPFYRERDVIVVGGGDTALQDALYLSGVCRNVTLVHRREQFRGAERLVRQLREKKNVFFMLSWRPEAFLQENGILTGLKVRRAEGDETRKVPAAGVFIAVGQQPGTGPAAGRLSLENGYLPAGEDCRTELPGVFVAGDCRAKEVRQLATAAGDGAVAGLAATDFALGSK